MHPADERASCSCSWRRENIPYHEPHCAIRTLEEIQRRTPKEIDVEEGIQHIPYSDFTRLDIRVGIINAAEPVPKKDRLMMLKVNVGGSDDRQIVAGIRQHYKAEDLVNKKIVVVCNLEPREVGGVLSQGMLLAAKNDAGGFALLTPDTIIASGSQVG